MTQHTVSLDLESALATPHRCAACGSTGLATTTPGDGGVLFSCLRCHRSWRFELGDLVLVAGGHDTRG